MHKPWKGEYNEELEKQWHNECRAHDIDACAQLLRLLHEHHPEQHPLVRKDRPPPEAA
jgi:hypothetical protein